MKVCGIELAASEARLVILDGTRQAFNCEDIKTKKITVKDDESAADIQQFKNDIFNFFRANDIEKISVRKRTKKGNFAGGPVSFKLEGIIQLYDAAEFSLLAAATVSAAARKRTAEVPTYIKKYQSNAFDTAYAGLS